MSWQGVEGIRGRQGLEGPKGEEVSSRAQVVDSIGKNKTKK